MRLRLCLVCYSETVLEFYFLTAGLSKLLTLTARVGCELLNFRLNFSNSTTTKLHARQSISTESTVAVRMSKEPAQMIADIVDIIQLECTIVTQISLLKCSKLFFGLKVLERTIKSKAGSHLDVEHIP